MSESKTRDNELRLAGKPVSARRGKIIAVASGKGGVGKTFLSITMSHALAKRGMRTLLFDGDLGLDQFTATAQSQLDDLLLARDSL